MTDSGLECETVSTVDELLGSDLKAWILHDVFEEHFDELEFCVAHFLQRHAHPTQTHRVLANGIEARLLAHLDALALAGPKAVEKVTASLLEEVDPNDATRVSAGVLALAGLDLTNDAFESPEPAQAPGSDGAESNVDLEALPPLEEEDLEADLVPPPEDAVPRPNADAIGRWWAKRGPSMRAATRHVLGEPCTATALLAALEAGPLGLRRGWAFALAIRSGGRAWLNTRAPSAEQRNVLADARPGDSARAGAGLARGG